MFEVGDYIVYGNNGVCEVIDVGPIQLSERANEKVYYTLEPVYEKGSKVYTPVDNKKVAMREVVSKEEALELIDNIPEIEFDAELTDKERERTIKESLKSIDSVEWIRILKALHFRTQERHADGKKMTSSDEKFMQAAEDNLYGELSISLDLEKDQVEDFIMNRLKESKLA